MNDEIVLGVVAKGHMFLHHLQTFVITDQKVAVLCIFVSHTGLNWEKHYNCTWKKYTIDTGR